jgi:hypothetical protein
MNQNSDVFRILISFGDDLSPPASTMPASELRALTQARWLEADFPDARGVIFIPRSSLELF